MQEKTTLYKIQRNAAAEHSIIVETFSADSTKLPHLLFCGGFHSNMRGNKANFLAGLCTQNGWGFTRFDYLGHGNSDAQAEHCTLHDWLADALAVLDSIPTPVVLVGSSMGAWLALHACLQKPKQVRALVTIAAAPDFTQKLLWPALSNDQKKLIENDQCVNVPTEYEGADWRIRASLFESGQALALLESAAPLNISIPIRMLHGTKDIDVPWQLSQQLLERLAQSTDASLTLIAGADHRLSDDNALAHLQWALESLVTRNSESVQ